MPITGRGDYPLRSSWFKIKQSRGGAEFFYKQVSFENRGSTSGVSTLIKDWFFNEVITGPSTTVFRKTLSTVGTRVGSRQVQG